MIHHLKKQGNYTDDDISEYRKNEIQRLKIILAKYKKMEQNEINKANREVKEQELEIILENNNSEAEIKTEDDIKQESEVKIETKTEVKEEVKTKTEIKTKTEVKNEVKNNKQKAIKQTNDNKIVQDDKNQNTINNVTIEDRENQNNVIQIFKQSKVSDNMYDDIEEEEESSEEV